MSNIDQDSHERKIAKRNAGVVTIKNIDNEPFSHSYDGVPYTLEPGEEMAFPFPMGNLFAKHLAMRILRKEAEERGELKGSADQQRVNLFTKEKVKAKMRQIEVNKEEGKAPAPEKTEAQKINDRAQQMQQETKNEVQAESAKITKADIIKELEKREIKYNPRDTKEDLLEQLKKSEMQG